MKINNLPGEFGFKMLYQLDNLEWVLSSSYYLTLEEAKKQAKLMLATDVKWPVETWDNGSVYNPDPSELE